MNNIVKHAIEVGLLTGVAFYLLKALAENQWRELPMALRGILSFLKITNRPKTCQKCGRGGVSVHLTTDPNWPGVRPLCCTCHCEVLCERRHAEALTSANDRPVEKIL